jgi:hypothetical protein
MTFKYVLILLLGAFLLYLLLLPKQTLLRKLFVLVFVGVMFIFSVRPEWSTVIANMLGIGRGSDFLFYVSHLMMFFVAFVYYLKFKDLEGKFGRVVRRLAILDAREPRMESGSNVRVEKL